MNEPINDIEWRKFINGTLAVLAKNCESEFGTLIGPLDDMLEVAHETAVVISIEIRDPTMADPLYNIFEKVIKDMWIPQYGGKTGKKRRKAQK